MRIPAICYKCGIETYIELVQNIDVTDVFYKLQNNYYCDECLLEYINNN